MRATLFLAAEALGFTLLLRAAMAPLWRQAGRDLPAVLGVWLLYAAGAVLLGTALNRVRRGRGLRSLGFRYHRGFLPDVWFGVLGYGILYLLTLPFDLAALEDRTRNAGQMLAQLSLSSPAAMLAAGSLFALLVGFVSGALHEEIRFRGYYQGAGWGEISPLAGFLMALIPFTFGHYFSHPNWSPFQVLATLIPGVLFGLLFNATGSLTVVITAHTLANWVGFHPALLAWVTQRPLAGVATACALALLFVCLLAFRGREEMRLLLEATVKTFRDRAGLGLACGTAIGLALLATWPLSWPPLHTAIAGIFLIGVSLVKRPVTSPRASQTAREP